MPSAGTEPPVRYESGYTLAARDVYVYVDNDIEVKAPRDAMRLAERLCVAWHSVDDGRLRRGHAMREKGSIMAVRARAPLRPERRRNPWPASPRPSASRSRPR